MHKDAPVSPLAAHQERIGAWFWFSFLWYDAWPERISLVHTCPFGSYLSDLRMGSIPCELFPVRTFDGYSGTHPGTITRCHHPVARTATSEIVGRHPAPPYYRRGAC